MRKIVWIALAVGMSLAPSIARADKDITPPDKTAPLASWTPSQQWMEGGDAYGYGNNAGMLLLADELGDRLSETGRASVIHACFHGVEKKAKQGDIAILEWALCGSDVKALDVKKLAAELDADGISGKPRDEIVKTVTETLERAQAVGAAVEEAAKNDPGLQKFLKVTDDAKAEWAAYIGKNKAAFDRYVALKDAVRSGKSNAPEFNGCYDATYPAFAKVIKARASKIPWDVGNDPMMGYMPYLLTTPDDYITTLSWAACAWSVDKSGEAAIAAAANQKGTFRAGWRTLALSKFLDKELKPKFADRSLGYSTTMWTFPVNMAGVNDIAKMMTPHSGEIGTLKAKDDMTQISFKGDQVEECLEWKDMGPGRDKVCKKRGMVANQTSAEEVPTKYLKAKVGDQIQIVNSFPVVSWKGKKLTALLGVPL